MHTHPTTGKPVVMCFVELRDLILASDNLPDLDIVQREMEQADLYYGSDWERYAGQLATLHHRRKNVIAKQLLIS
jgi:hypothetical protein